MTSLTPAIGRQLSKANYIATMAALDANLPRDTSIALLHCPDEARAEIPVVRTPTHFGSMQSVKQALDPNNILNRGRFLF